MNWFRTFVRFALAFVVLYLLGYVVPGFSGLTIPMVALFAIAIALVSAWVEHTVDFGSNMQRALTILLISGVIIYFLAFVLVGRPPVVSVAFAAILVSLVEFVFSKPIKKERKMMP